MKTKQSLPLVVAVIICFGVMLLDSLVVRGVAETVAYIIPVMLSLSAIRSKNVYFIASLASVLTLVGYFLAPELELASAGISLANRILVIFAIWTTAVLGLRYGRTLVELNRSEKELAHIVKQSEDAIYSVGVDGKVSQWNKGAEKLYGYSQTEVVGKNIQEFIRDLKPKSIRSLMRQASKRKDAIQVEFTRHNRDGEVITVLSSVSCLQRDSGSSIGFFAIEKDITFRKEAEQALGKARREADRANQAKSIFLANMSHEIRTPLTAIIGFSELLEMEAKQYPWLVSHSQRISYNALHLKQLIEDILDLSKIESGSLELQNEEIFLKTELNKLFKSLAAQAGLKGIHLTTDYGENLPYVIYSDSLKIRQILTNIVGNAIKFTDKGEVHIQVSYTREHRLEFRVQDTGCGIPSQNISKLFRPFSQGDAGIAKRYAGTGLGLVLCKKLAEAMGGNVFLETSEVGKGSCFVFWLPCSVKVGGAPLPVLDASATHISLKGRKVLIIEDSEEIVALIEKHLKRAGAVYSAALNAQAGIYKARREYFDLVLMDIRMPEMDGFSCARLLRENGYEGPIVAVSAQLVSEDIQQLDEAGLNDWVSKPFTYEELVSAIERNLSSHLIAS